MDVGFFSLTIIIAQHVLSLPPGARTALVYLAFDIAHENNA